MMICDVFKQVPNAEHVTVGSGFFGMGVLTPSWQYVQ